jgi:RimJ/RimL family protein N-acetyltransferase
MQDLTNAYGQPVGQLVQGWTARPLPPATAMAGRYCRLERADAERHAADLFAAYAEAEDDRDWTYLLLDAPGSAEQYAAWLRAASARPDPLFHAIIDQATGKACGIAAYMRIDPANGVIEVGHINLAPRLKRTRAATEAMFLMMRRAFDELGYRRYEWKCDSLNAPSRKAAARYGFRFEGIFRQAVVYKGRNRDTAWFSITDTEWPHVRAEFERWLDPGNFDAEGLQREPLDQMFA